MRAMTAVAQRAMAPAVRRAHTHTHAPVMGARAALRVPSWACATRRGTVSGPSIVTRAAATETTTAEGAVMEPQDVVAVLRERGLVADVTSDELAKAAASGQLRVYCGFDPTADSLHLGNLLGIIVLSWFQRCGHVPYALVGGATGRVGDPSGKSAERPVLSEDVINGNVEGIRALLQRLLNANSPEGAPEVCIVNNLDWFGPMSFIGFLRDIGKFARVGTMLSKDSVKTRLDSESGMSYTEFTYQLLQGYDFVHLCKEEGVRVQVGGSDQWGNITAGTELVRKLLGGGDEEEEVDKDERTCFGLTFPLLTDSNGKKFGKSEGGAIWLTADKLSPFKFYQHLFKTTDADVIKFLRMLTFLPLDEIDAIEASMSAEGYVPNTAQKRLAEELTRFVHGQEGLEQALATTAALKPGADTVLNAEVLEAIAGDAPSATLSKAEVVGAQFMEVMVAAGLQDSKAAVKRLCKGGGARMNNVQVKDPSTALTEEDLIDGTLVLLAAGKKNKLLLRVE